MASTNPADLEAARSAHWTKEALRARRTFDAGMDHLVRSIFLSRYGPGFFHIALPDSTTTYVRCPARTRAEYEVPLPFLRAAYEDIADADKYVLVVEVPGTSGPHVFFDDPVPLCEASIHQMRQCGTFVPRGDILVAGVPHRKLEHASAWGRAQECPRCRAVLVSEEESMAVASNEDGVCALCAAVK